MPPGFVVRTEAFEAFIRLLDKEQPLRAPIEALDPHDLETVGAVTKAIRARVEGSPLPPALRDAILSAHAELCAGMADAPVAVRSSATTEDAEDASFAGLQDTYLWVLGGDQVLHMVRSCWASLYSVESVVLSPEARSARGRSCHGRRGTADGRCALRRRDVHPQSDNRRPVRGDRRRRLGTWLRRRLRRGYAGSLGHRQDHRARSPRAIFPTSIFSNWPRRAAASRTCLYRRASAPHPASATRNCWS